MKPGDAKASWDRWTSALTSEQRAAKRRELAIAIDLDLLAKRSASFGRFLADLRAPS